jgi:CHAD domain-containing protein
LPNPATGSRDQARITGKSAAIARDRGGTDEPTEHPHTKEPEVSGDYRLEPGEPVSSEILRCATAQLDRAVTELTRGVDADPEQAVHAARKAIKKERSLLRLARGSIGDRRRRRENDALRQAARTLSAARDAEALLATLDDLSERYVGQLPEHTFTAVRAPFERRRDAQRERLGSSDLTTRAAADLSAVRARIDDWKLTGGGWSALEAGLRRSYRDGRTAFGAVQDQRSGADWHQWRKRVKDLWYHERLLSAVAGPACAGQAKDAHRLADLLGDDHDLVVLRQAVTGEASHTAADLDAVVALIDHHQQELRRQALQLGARVYAEKPKLFVRRMRAMWRAGRGQQDVAAVQRPAQLAQATRSAHVV